MERAMKQVLQGIFLRKLPHDAFVGAIVL